MRKKNKLNKFSSFQDVIYFIIFLIPVVLVGNFFNVLFYSIVIYQAIFILYMINSQYLFEKWIFDFKNNSHISYPNKYQYAIKELKDNKISIDLVTSKFSALENRFKELSESMPDAVIVVDKNFTTEWFNQASIKMLALNEGDVGKSILHLIRNPDFMKYIKSDKRKSHINFLSPRDYSITLQSFVVPYGENRQMITFRDVSESDKLDKMRQDFIANVSHELKTPLTVIFGYLEMLSFSDDGYVDDNIIEEMLKQSKRMDNLISDLLKLTKLQSTGIPDKDFSTANLKTLIKDLYVSCKPEIKKNKSNVKILNTKDIYIRCSYEEVYSAFLNLFTNAITYAGENVTIEINYYINEKKQTVVTFQDYGVGIPEDSVERLTERFYRIDKGRSRAFGGTGLGLSIVKHIMNRHDGSLDIQSTLGEGSTFTCTFPKSLFSMELPKSSSNI